MDIYEKLVKGYTEKQWGRPCRELPAFLIKRLPLRFTFDNSYFTDSFQGVPINGYTSLAEKLLEDITVRTGCDYLSERAEWNILAKRVVFTGSIDAYFDYVLGPLEYRTIRLETEVLDIPNAQGVAVMNYTDRETPYTRIIEHKHFVQGQQPQTVVSREFPCEWSSDKEPFYPINDVKNQALFERYKELALHQPWLRLGGRLGEYRYYDMDRVVESALIAAQEEMKHADEVDGRQS